MTDTNTFNRELGEWVLSSIKDCIIEWGNIIPIDGDFVYTVLRAEINKIVVDDLEQFTKWCAITRDTPYNTARAVLARYAESLVEEVIEREHFPADMKVYLQLQDTYPLCIYNGDS